MFSGTCPASRVSPQCPLLVSFLASATNWLQVAGGPLIPAAANSALL